MLHYISMTITIWLVKNYKSVSKLLKAYEFQIGPAHFS